MGLSSDRPNCIRIQFQSCANDYVHDVTAQFHT